MKKIEEYVKMELFQMCSELEIECNYRMNKSKIYNLLTKYYKKVFTKKDQGIYLNEQNITGYCGKDEINDLTKMVKTHKFYEITLKKLKQLEDRKYSERLLKELSFFLDEGKYLICDNIVFNLLVIETKDKYGFMAPMMLCEELEED